MGNRNIFLCEGDNELKFVKAFFIGKTKKVNLWEDNVNKILRTLNQDNIYVVFDTDVLDNKERFITNIRTLNQKTKANIYLLQQLKNFEDELCFACSCRENELFLEFSASSNSEFKSNFNSIINIKQKLSNFKFDINQLYSRNIINELHGCTQYQRKKLDINEITR